MFLRHAQASGGIVDFETRTRVKREILSVILRFAFIAPRLLPPSDIVCRRYLSKVASETVKAPLCDFIWPHGNFPFS
jgi:hypothetical protein